MVCQGIQKRNSQMIHAVWSIDVPNNWVEHTVEVSNQKKGE